MEEFRCKCSKLLSKVDIKEGRLEIVCPKCKRKNTYKVEAQEAQGEE